MFKYIGRTRSHEAAWAEKMKLVIHFLQSFATHAKARLNVDVGRYGWIQQRFKEPKSTYLAGSLGVKHCTDSAERLFTTWSSDGQREHH